MGDEEQWDSNLDYTGIVREYDIRALANKLILPAPPSASNQYQPASFDLTIGVIITPEKTITEKSDIKEVKLSSGGLATILTYEELCIPKDLIATAFTMNSLRQRGLLILGAGHIDPGYKGVLTLEIINFQRTPFKLRIGDPIITVTFEKMAKATNSYQGLHMNLEERISKMREFVDETALAALLDLNGNGLEPLVDKAIVSKFDYQQNVTLDLAKRYDIAMEERLIAKLDSINRKLTDLETGVIKKGQLFSALGREFIVWIAGLIVLGAALGQLIEYILRLLHILQ